MFRFNFGSAPDVQSNSPPQCQVMKAREIKPSVSSVLPSAPIQIEHLTINLIQTSLALENIRKDLDENQGILEAESSHSDLVSGVYEGGLKVWECSFDLAKYLIQIKDSVENKRVLDLGCGSGVLGILAYKLGASSVDFHDYNVGVLKHFTIPNLNCNEPEMVVKSRFWSGDWEHFVGLDVGKYDLILTSETIYNVNYLKKLHSVLKEKLETKGTIYVAGKSYYFGVGGSIRLFKDLVDSQKQFDSRTVWTSQEGVKREILELKFC